VAAPDRRAADHLDPRMQHPAWNVGARASALHRDALVWDNHGCMPFADTERWLELIDACAQSGGVVCINGIGIFLGDNDIRVARFVDHVDYVVQHVGAAHFGVGLDYVFDQSGMDVALASAQNMWPEGFGYRAGIKFLAPEELRAVTEELPGRGYDEGSIRGILGGNLLRVADEVWRR
jgi:membrane dipeptidase